MSSNERPIFIRGLSRSGGTLFVTIMDAHPDISMSYEIYPNLLASLIANPAEQKFFSRLMSSKAVFNKKYTGSRQKLRTFIARSYRSGLTNDELLQAWNNCCKDSDRKFTDESDCMHFIAEVARTKMAKEHKSFWGMKCTGAFEKYVEIWPEARFINIVRDGRDILASQLNAGSFNKSVEEVATAYNKGNKRFSTLMENKSFKGMNVQYERLINNSADILQEVCDFIGVEYDSSMLNFYKKELTIFENSMGHLSIDRISKPIDATQIGRWKSDLTTSQADDFSRIAKETLIKFGYIKE